MKFNWGNGITVAIILFMGFILFMVFKMVSTNTDLYVEDYYNQEIKFQDKIDAKSNLASLKGAFKLEVKEKVIEVTFPDDFRNKIVTGQVNMYKPDNAKLDKSYKINLNNNIHYVMLNDLVKGNYTLTVDMIEGEIRYLYEREFTIY